MKTRFLTPYIKIALGLIVLSGTAKAQSFTYTVENSQATITGFSADPAGAITIPSTLGGATVTEIGRSAFLGRNGITAITFAAPSSVTKIGPAAFQDCTGLASIVLPSGTTLLPAGVLQGCTSLTSVTLPSTVIQLGDAAFAGCRSLASLNLPGSLTSLGDSAFLDCRSLTSLTIPSGVTEIPSQLCRDCWSLSSLGLPAGITRIQTAAFAGCGSLTNFTVPDAAVSVGAGAFLNATALASLSIPADLTDFDISALHGCDLLASITVASGNAVFSSVGGVLYNNNQTALLCYPPARSGAYSIPASVTQLGDGCFRHAWELENLVIPTGVAVLGADAFYYAHGIAGLTFSNGLTTLGDWSLAGTGITGVVLPASLTTVGYSALAHSPVLHYAIFNGNAPPAFATEVFDSPADDFTVCFYARATGFTVPLWQGYASAVIEISADFIAWKAAFGIPQGSAAASDPNGDGVPLIMAYALGLDPASNLSTSLPAPILTNGETPTLGLTFYGARTDINYSVEASSDLENWSSTEVVLTAPDTLGVRTAVTAISGDRKFLRLVVAP